ncbi:hypothetical protein D9757_008671 [Collybiopsis confluens]|uniref:Uncharacterized protein n=1 Tax=Collybiopsis confluens TaxID=2823264 RepID=A0A8H5H4F7_9AGAR|nr:hypothetical protein D9757_008671 [Collybiopsis confluens]
MSSFLFNIITSLIQATAFLDDVMFPRPPGALQNELRDIQSILENIVNRIHSHYDSIPRDIIHKYEEELNRIIAALRACNNAKDARKFLGNSQALRESVSQYIRSISAAGSIHPIGSP